SFSEINSFKCFAIIGSAGCGKSTILMRLGMMLTQNSKKVYFTNSESLPSPVDLANALSLFKERIVLMFDNAETALGYLPHLDKTLKLLTIKPIIVISTRTNDFDRLLFDFNSDMEIIEKIVPNLEMNEIENIIEILKKNSLLGKLNGMTNSQRINEFVKRSKKQLLVSMREATSGQGFDSIIRDEFEKIVPFDAKMLCLCTAIATDIGLSVSKGELISISENPPNMVLNYLERNLQGVVIPVNENNERFWLRHRTIAEFIVTEASTSSELQVAYIRLLTALSTIIVGKKFNHRSFRLYREIINHKNLYYRLNKSIKSAREVFDALRIELSHDFHYWLQYGSLELEGGDIVLAENYLEQALSIQPMNGFANNAKGHLLLKKALHIAINRNQAYSIREEAEELLFKSMTESGMEDPYVYHIYCHQMFYWIKKWVIDDDEKKSELEELLKICDESLQFHRRNKRLQTIRKAIYQTYLNLSISPEIRPKEPELPKYSLFY
ncbi:MAG: ATP-binding protein, partial [Saprospiraceae bacterium]|nr:ATP-binding protein [Saprospiraceae bacterium]